MKVIITGASGMVGRGVLLECLDDPRVESVLSVGRSPLPDKHPKLTEIILEDLSDLSGVGNSFEGVDACFFCMGVTSMRKTEEEYRRLTYDMAINFARRVHDSSPSSTFVYVSSEGADTSEEGRMMWARVRGKTENDILKMGFKGAYMFRPGAIIPERGITSKTLAYKIFLSILKVIGPPVMRLAPRYMTSTSNVGKAMINVAANGYSKEHLNSADINIVGE